MNGDAMTNATATEQSNLAGKNQLFERIAQECLGVPTLRARGRDALDFYEVPVWGLATMMSRAYDAGFQAGKRDASKEADECHQ